jgi:Cu(I)/Ag(I) efflux system membrane protein CusA/SilA
MGTGGALEPSRQVLLAQMGMGEGGDGRAPTGRARANPQTGGLLSDAPAGWLDTEPPQAAPGGAAGEGGGRFVPLGQLADVRITGGPAMIRDDGGLLVGVVYLEIDGAARDVGGYVEEAKALVRRAQADGRLPTPPGSFLKWTGQYELMEELEARMKLVLPATLLLIALLLWLHFRDLTEVLIVLLSIPFALVGSVWLLAALDYRMSTAVWVGIIALAGLAAQTGIVMIVYIDNAYARRKAAGRIRDLSDIVRAHMEGTVQRVRPKLMTVGTMLAGLTPLLWATGSGADVMKRIAAPMVGGLLTSAFLTLEIIPVVYTYWRHEQLLWERLALLDAGLLERLRVRAVALRAAWSALAAVGVATFYLEGLPAWAFWAAAAVALAAALGAAAAYLALRPGAFRLVWPEPAARAA